MAFRNGRPNPGAPVYSGVVAMLDPPPPSAESLAGRLEFETLIADLSSRFINLPPAQVDPEIEDALRRVCELLDLDLAVLWQWVGNDRHVVAPTHVHPHHADGPRAVAIQDQYPWTVAQMLAGRPVVCASLDQMPAEAVVDRESASRAGIKSNLTLPLAVGGDPPVGALAFSTTVAERTWPPLLVQRLGLVAQVFTNALARRRADEALREAEARVGLAADSAEAGLWTLDDVTGVFWVTNRTRAIFGFGPDEFIDMARFQAAVYPEDWEGVRDGIERALRRLAPVDVEYRIARAPDERMCWIAARGQLQRHATGSPPHLMGCCIDVTARKLAEQLVRVSEARLAAGAELAGLGFYEVDFAAGTMYTDDRTRALCGAPPGTGGLQVLQFWLEHLHPDDRERMLEAREQLHAGPENRLSIEYRYRHPVRGELWIHHLAGVAARDGTGRAVSTYGVLRDITERRRAEEALRRSYEEIERLKDRLQAESDYLKAEIRVTHAHDEVTGQSAVIKRILRQVEQVAPTGSSVLICGETGTGKERIAQAIHRLSPRGTHLMVKVNCAALPAGLVESELFGREKGAFTGALTRQVGRFELAHGSTIFLDEVGELSLDLQAKLLRVLETGEFERLGSPRTIKVDVRLLAATNRDLAEEIKKGRFREDLYYRLNVFPIRVPPLRERAEDIPLLVWTLLEEFSVRMGKKITQVPRTTMEALQLRPWRGNVRELRNVIEHGAIITEGDTLRVPLLDDASAELTQPVTMADAEREHILRALERSGWHIKGPHGAAAALGLKPATLYSRMKKLGIVLRR
jgi:PAS domain S-box-containing protein